MHDCESWLMHVYNHRSRPLDFYHILRARRHLRYSDPFMATRTRHLAETGVKIDRCNNDGYLESTKCRLDCDLLSPPYSIRLPVPGLVELYRRSLPPI